MKNKTSTKIIYGLFAIAIAVTGLNLAVNVQKASAEWWGNSWISSPYAILSCDMENNPSDNQGFICAPSMSIANTDSNGNIWINAYGGIVADACQMTEQDAQDTGIIGNTGSYITWISSADGVPGVTASVSDSAGGSSGGSLSSYTYAGEGGTSGQEPCGDRSAAFGSQAGGGFEYTVDSSDCIAPATTYNVDFYFSDDPVDIAASASTTVDCPDNNQQQPPTDNSNTATINVNADRSTSWKISGGGTSFTGTNETSDSYTAPASDSGTQYNLVDPATLNAPYGFNVDNSGTVLRNPSSILARVVKSVEASDCSGWTCDLTTNGTINYNLNSTYCNITVQTTVDGNIVPLTGLSYDVEPDADNSPNNFTDTPETFPLIADPLGNTQFSINGFSPPSTITYNGKTADLSDVSPVNNPVCSGTDGTSGNPFPNVTFTANYKTRASINIH